jgi:hypothetical protein
VSAPRSFTAFRRSINQAIAPLEVDDVSFVTDGWTNAAGGSSACT